MTIRPIEERDRAALAEIVRRAGNFSHEEVETALELIDHSIASKNTGDYISFVLDESQAGLPAPHVKGFVCIGPASLTQGVYDLYWIVVDAAARGRQYGQRLLRFAEEEVKRRGGRMVLIETSSLPEYDGTRRFYLAAGYPEIARIPNFYKPGDDKVIYAKEVANV
jgi:ribosomal protein S18 acetylase RimI-like enzyme